MISSIPYEYYWDANDHANDQKLQYSVTKYLELYHKTQKAYVINFESEFRLVLLL